jgi:hypothetical protein
MIPSFDPIGITVDPISFTFDLVDLLYYFRVVHVYLRTAV